MAHSKCLSCRARVWREGAAGEDLCPGCGGPLQTVAELSELVGLRRLWVRRRPRAARRRTTSSGSPSRSASRSCATTPTANGGSTCTARDRRRDAPAIPPLPAEICSQDRPAGRSSPARAVRQADAGSHRSGGSGALSPRSRRAVSCADARLKADKRGAARRTGTRINRRGRASAHRSPPEPLTRRISPPGGHAQPFRSGGWRTGLRARRSRALRDASSRPRRARRTLRDRRACAADHVGAVLQRSPSLGAKAASTSRTLRPWTALASCLVRTLRRRPRWPRRHTSVRSAQASVRLASILRPIAPGRDVHRASVEGPDLDPGRVRRSIVRGSWSCGQQLPARDRWGQSPRAPGRLQGQSRFGAE